MLAARVTELEASVDRLQQESVEEWLRLVRHGSVVPRFVETSASWRITRPLRLAETAVGVLRREGAHRFWATVRGRLGRMLKRS